MLDRLGLIQAVDFGGCGGPQSPAGKPIPRVPVRTDRLMGDGGRNETLLLLNVSVSGIVRCAAGLTQICGVQSYSPGFLARESASSWARASPSRPPKRTTAVRRSITFSVTDITLLSVRCRLRFFPAEKSSM